VLQASREVQEWAQEHLTKEKRATAELSAIKQKVVVAAGGGQQVPLGDLNRQKPKQLGLKDAFSGQLNDEVWTPSTRRALMIMTH
jgi:hypothetical protein